MRIARFPIACMAGLSAILLAVGAFTDIEVPFVWAISPLWIPLVAACGLGGCVVGIVACIILAVVGIVVGIIGLAASVIALVCGIVMALLTIAAALAVAGAMFLGAVLVMKFMFTGQGVPGPGFIATWKETRRQRKAVKDLEKTNAAVREELRDAEEEVVDLPDEETDDADDGEDLDVS